MSQNTEKEKKQEIVINYFMEHPTMYINDIANATGIPKSTVQRYLQNNDDLIIPGTNLTIREQLKLNKMNGQKKGGINSFRNNDHIKDENGKFIGSVQTTSTIDKEENKRLDIKLLCTYFLEHSTLTMDEMNHIFNELGLYTSDYIYDCLTDSRVQEIMGKEKANIIKEKLSLNQYSVLRKLGNLDIESIIHNIPLGDVEKIIYEKRFLENKSLDEVAEILNISRARVAIIEDKLIEKIKRYSKGSSK